MEINLNDLIVQTYRKSSENGNWLNKPDTCVRIVHVPSSTVVDECEDRSVHRNKANAMKKLEKLLDDEQEGECMTEWIKNTSGECPVPERTRIDVKFRDGEILNNVPSLTTFNGRDTQAAFWRLDGGINDIVYWRLHKPNKTLDDALGEHRATCSAEAFDAMAEAQWEGRYKYPETIFEPLPVHLSHNALVASIFNTLYPEPCALREVHVEALKAIMKLVDERGGE